MAKKSSYDLDPASDVDNNPAPISDNQDINDAGDGGYNPRIDDRVFVTDTSPIIILFGAGASGKTTALIRLTKYLRSVGYQVSPDRTFRDARDTGYQNKCKEFLPMVNRDIVPPRTNPIDFMLVKVIDQRGKPICQLLEAPGEHYFNPEFPNKPFRQYLNTITQSSNRRTWVIIVEKDWTPMDYPDARAGYTDKIKLLQHKFIHPTDKVIFLCSKANEFSEYMNGTQYIDKRFFEDIKNQYSGIFTRYENKNPITKWAQPYNFEFVVFSSGVFNEVVGDEEPQPYTPSRDSDPRRLWEAILRTVKGSFF